LLRMVQDLRIATCCLYFPLQRLGYLPPVADLFDVLCWNGCPDEDYTSIATRSLLNYNKPIKQILDTDKIDKNKSSILVEKSHYRLTFFYDKQPIKSYPVVFGANPVGDKLKAGDKRTPEGKFKIKDLYPHAAWSKFIWLDYPTKSSWRKHFKAKGEGQINWHDSIGSEIGIHGTPDDALISKKSNWSLGCVSLKNKDVDELYQFVQKGTEVEIIP
jgi:lipoprotein-anchoring transpeptidase ErfK/SrfK